jgi:hypothetical protein
MYGYEPRYLINQLGEIKRTNRVFITSNGQQTTLKEKKIAIRVDKRSGYLVVKITKLNGHAGSQYVHRLIAQTFLPNPDNKLFVNHLNGIKTDCSLENLEWVTHSENQKHAIRMNLSKLPVPKTVPVINICSGQRFNSILEASKVSCINYDRCKKMLSGITRNNTCLRRAA